MAISWGPMVLKRLNIGCGYNSQRHRDVINCDLTPGPNVDMVFDAQKAFPFETGSIGGIQANHVLEHLKDFETFFAECWRVLAPGGLVILSLPHGNSDAAYGDITHVTAWNPARFCFLQPGYDKSIGNPQHQEPRYAFEVEAIFERVSNKFRWFCRWPLWQLVGRHILDYVWNGYCELHVQLRALKTEDQLKGFTREPNHVPVSRMIYRQDLYKQAWTDGERPDPIYLDHWRKGLAFQRGK